MTHEEIVFRVKVTEGRAVPNSLQKAIEKAEDDVRFAFTQNGWTVEDVKHYTRTDSEERGMRNIKCIMSLDTKYKEGVVYTVRKVVANELVTSLPHAFEYEEEDSE